MRKQEGGAGREQRSESSKGNKTGDGGGGGGGVRTQQKRAGYIHPAVGRGAAGLPAFSDGCAGGRDVTDVEAETSFGCMYRGCVCHDVT